MQNSEITLFAKLFYHIPQILFILGVAYLIRRYAGGLIEQFVRRVIISKRLSSPEAEQQREDTLIRILTSTLSTVVWVLALLTLLQEIGVAIGPLMAAAGITGLALGLGSQYIIRDCITGLILIMEDQYRVGDVVSLEGVHGRVEDISLRMTTLRDLDGTVHHIPHGEIKKSANRTKNFSRVHLNIGISYQANLESTIALINQIGKELAEAPEWKHHIITPPQFLRVEDFGDNGITLKILGETQPLKQWEVAGEFRKRIKITFDQNKIELRQAKPL